MDDKIKKSIDNIEPDDSAKERMYANIMKKAQQQKTEESPKRKTALRFINYALPVAACLCIAVFTTVLFKNNVPVESSDSEPLVQVTAPPQYEQTAPDTSGKESFEQIAPLPSMPADSTDITYSVYDSVACAAFTSGGHNYLLYAEKDRVIGPFGDKRSSEKITYGNGTEAVLTVFDDGSVLTTQVSWNNGDIHYYLCNSDNADSETVKKTAEMMTE